jgi:hypothetical protein
LRSTLSPELNAKEIAEALGQGGAWEILVYGRAQLMLLSHCPRRLCAGERGCAACDRGEPLPPLVDRKGYAFPMRRLRMAHGCQVRLLNSLPTWLLDKHSRALAQLGRQAPLSWRLCFAEEPPGQCASLLRRARAIRDGLPAGEAVEMQSTSGHFARGVE